MGDSFCGRCKITIKSLLFLLLEVECEFHSFEFGWPLDLLSQQKKSVPSLASASTGASALPSMGP